MSKQGWRSYAEWPVASGINTSHDDHDTREAAEAVCRGLKREGLGGEGKVFPIRTMVVPIGCHYPLGCDCRDCTKRFGPIHPGNVGKDLRSNPAGEVSSPRFT